MRSKTQQSPGRASRPLEFRLERAVWGIFFNLSRPGILVCFGALLLLPIPALGILAGQELGTPEDRPSWRIDPLKNTSSFNFVGGLEIFGSDNRSFGSGSALSPHWVLTAGHNVDFNDDGSPDAGLNATFHLPGFGAFQATHHQTHPDFTGFGNPSIHHDLSLLYFADPLPTDLAFPVLGLPLKAGDVVTLAGFGRSGYGNYGYTTEAGMENRRIGQNTVNSLTYGDSGQAELFRYTFDAPDSPNSLGNPIETLIGPGDSGGPVLSDWLHGTALVGVSTFTEGYGGRFGDVGGGIVLDPYWDWIGETTGLALIPEPAFTALLPGAVFLLAVGLLRIRRSRNHASRG